MQFDPSLSGKWLELLKQVAPATLRPLELFSITSLKFLPARSLLLWKVRTLTASCARYGLDEQEHAF
jgi:hypothetical protein